MVSTTSYISSRDDNVIRNIIIRVNEDPDYRAHFFRNPIEVMEAEGLTFNEVAREELMMIHKSLIADLDEFSRIPTGYDSILNKLKGEDDEIREPIPLFVN